MAEICLNDVEIEVQGLRQELLEAAVVGLGEALVEALDRELNKSMYATNKKDPSPQIELAARANYLDLRRRLAQNLAEQILAQQPD